MDLPSSTSLLEAFSNAEDVDRLERGSNDLGETHAPSILPQLLHRH
jgi:hypothetical protein